MTLYLSESAPIERWDWNEWAQPRFLIMHDTRRESITTRGGLRRVAELGLVFICRRPMFRGALGETTAREA